MTREEVKQLKIGDEVIYTNLYEYFSGNQISLKIGEKYKIRFIHFESDESIKYMGNFYLEGCDGLYPISCFDIVPSLIIQPQYVFRQSRLDIIE